MISSAVSASRFPVGSSARMTGASDGCTDQKNGGDQDTNVGNSVEFDVTDIDVDAETRPDAEDNSDSVSLPDGYTYSSIFYFICVV